MARSSIRFAWCWMRSRSTLRNKSNAWMTRAIRQLVLYVHPLAGGTNQTTITEDLQMAGDRGLGNVQPLGELRNIGWLV